MQCSARGRGPGGHSTDTRLPEPPLISLSLAYENTRVMKAMEGAPRSSAFLQSQPPSWLKARSVDSLFTSTSKPYN